MSIITIKRDIGELVNKNKLVSKGSRKSGYWKLN